jgi:glycosyltransferase involved in cell wall biosynthesis
LIKALTKIDESQGSFRFVFYGQFSSQDERANFEQEASHHGLLKWFELHPHIDRSGVFQAMRECDVLLLITHSLGSENAIPAKLFEYIGAKRPILAITHDPYVVSAVKKHHLGWIVGHNNTDELDDVFHQWQARPDWVRLMRKTLPGLELTEYDAEKQLDRLYRRVLQAPPLQKRETSTKSIDFNQLAR